MTFESEFNAYLIAQQHPKIKKLVPEFFGKVEVCKIYDENDDDITEQFEVACAYQMLNIEGVYNKTNLIKQSEFTKAVLLEFNEVGISYTIDSSGLFDENGDLLCLIDFGTVELQPEFKDF